MKPGRKEMVVGVAVLLGLLVLANIEARWRSDRDAKVEEEAPTFKGYQCRADCSGHRAGYEWAERQGIKSPDQCGGGNSLSFTEGCLAYVDEQ